MVDYDKPTGSTGTMKIRDTGTYVEFYIRSGNSTTYNYQMPWAYVINGVTSSWKYFRYEKGAGYELLGRWNVTTTQTVTFKLGDTGTSGLGGPTTHSVKIDRATAPSPPSVVTLSNITHNSVYATFSDGANGGAAIDARQIGFGTETTNPTKNTVSSDRSTTIPGLSPGTTYYFWARTRNAKGWSAWGPRSTAKTHNVPSAPATPTISGVTPISAIVSWTPPANNGASIVEYQVGYGASSTGPATTVTATASPRTVTGLVPGTRYYFWVRARNAVGWGAWSAASSNQTIAGARIRVGGVWKIAVPYVKVGGVWKLARPWARSAGVWKQCG